MSRELDSWEDDPAAQDENLYQQARNLNLNQANTFIPGTRSFQPGASNFQPGQQYQPQGGYQQQQQQQYGYPQQQAYNGYPQYQQPSFNQYNQNYAQQQPMGLNQNQGGQFAAYNQSPGSYKPPQSRQAPISIAKRPATDATAPTPAAAKLDNTASPKAKVLSIGAEGTAPKPKVLSIGVPSSPAPAAPKTASPTSKEAPKVPEAGAKVAATKAVEKAGAGKASPSPSSGKSSPTPGEAKKARTAEELEKEQEADVDDRVLKEMYGKEHVNLIFIGHVDAGKSTLGGRILIETGMVDDRTIEKYRRDAKDAGRESWWISWVLDLNKEERAKGKTVEVGRGFFETEKRRYTILDAPGHKTFVPNMIGGASQADVGILVISARKGEYETGFEKGGQTREHAMLAKTQGVNKLIVAVNKMDDTTVEWSKDRYDECLSKLSLFLKGVGYNPKTDLSFLPISAQTGIGIKTPVGDVAKWYTGPSLLEMLDGMAALERKVKAPFMMPIGAKYRDMGTMIEGRIEAGVITKGSTFVMMPNREEIGIAALYGETEEEIPHATCGDQVRMRVRGIEEEDILPGFVLCSPRRPVHCVSAFEAQIVILELKSILSAGFNCVMHVHAATEEVTFAALLHKLEKGTGRKSKKPPPFAARGQSIIARLEITSGANSVCVERFEDYPTMGRFTLRDQGQTIAIGKITKLITDPVAVA